MIGLRREVESLRERVRLLERFAAFDREYPTKDAALAALLAVQRRNMSLPGIYSGPVDWNEQTRNDLRAYCETRGYLS